MFDFEINSKVKMTVQLRERFCKDMNLPIKIFDSPYFESRINLFDSFLDCKKSYEDFVSLVSYYGSEASYFEAYSKLKDDVISFLNDCPEMLHFAKNEDMSSYKCKNEGFPSKDIYKMTFDGSTFCSIDMKKANFTALHYYNPAIVGYKDTYESFLRMFTDKSYFIRSKYIRQVVFGNVNPKRQVTLEKYMMDSILTGLLDSGFDTKDIVCFSNDEIVICLDRQDEFKDRLMVSMYDIIECEVDKATKKGINVRSEFFTLHKINGTTGFVKKFLEGEKEFEFKCLGFLEYPFVARAYKYEEPTEEDYTFIFDGHLVKLLDKIDVKVV